MATKTSVGSGLWSVAGTWDAGVPVDNDVVVIAAGHVVEFDVDQSGFANGIDGLTINGTLYLTRTAGTYYLKIKIGKAISGSGLLDAGNSGSVIPFTAKHTIEGNNQDMIQGASGLTLTAYGIEPAIKIVYLTQVEAIGATVLHIDTDVTGDIWADADRITVIDINSTEFEDRVIAAGGISSNTITITAGLTAQKEIGAMIVLTSRNVRFWLSTKSTMNAPSAIYNIGSGKLTLSGIEITSIWWGVRGVTDANIIDCTFRAVNNGFSGTSSSITRGYYIGPYCLNGISLIVDGAFTACGQCTFTGSTVSNIVSRSNNTTPVVMRGGTLINPDIRGVGYGVNGSGCVIYDGYIEASIGCLAPFSGAVTNCTLRKRGYAYAQIGYNYSTGDFAVPDVTLTNCDMGSPINYDAMALCSQENYSESIDHNQVSGEYMAWTKGGTTSSQAAVLPSGYTKGYKTVLKSTNTIGWWRKEITIGAGASVNITMNLRKDASMAYLPRVIVFNKALTDPFAGGAGLHTFTMTDSIDTWEDDLYTYTNTGTEDVTLVIRCQGMNATGNMYSALDVEQINVDLTDAIALITAVKSKTDNLPADPASEATVNTRLATSGYTAPPSVSDIVTGVWGATTRTLTSFGTLIADIWGYATRTLSAFGFTVSASPDANVALIKAKTDNLPASPAAVGSAMTLTAGERTAIANEVESQIINEADAERVLTAITDKIASVNPSLDDLTLAGIASAVRTELATELARIDATISSRLASVGYTSPANADVAAIKAKTDNLPNDPADQSILAALIGALPAAPSEMDIVNALKSSVFDGILTFEDSIKLYNAILFGKLDGGSTGTLKFRDPADTKDRVTATVDISTGDRDDITLDLT